jgi:hypothetical protein
MEREQAYRHFLIIDVSLHMHPTDVGVVCKIIRERAIMGLKLVGLLAMRREAYCKETKR